LHDQRCIGESVDIANMVWMGVRNRHIANVTRFPDCLGKKEFCLIL
jgi:hypothetical protein